MAGLKNSTLKFTFHLDKNLYVEFSPSLLEDYEWFLVQGSLRLIKTIMKEKRDRVDVWSQRLSFGMDKEDRPSLFGIRVLGV